MNCKSIHPSTSLEDKITGCLIGVAIGDALGAPFEGKNPAAINRKIKSNDGLIKDFHPFFGGLGTWTDDTGMTLAVCRALIKHERTRKSMETCFREAFYDWINSDESRGSGRTVTYAAKHGVADLNAWSSGALMRTSPVSIYAYQKGYTVHQAADLAYWVASLSHGHPQATFPGVECTLALLSIFRKERSVPAYLDDPESLVSQMDPDQEDRREDYKRLRHWQADDLDPTTGLFIWKKVFEDCLGLKPGVPWSRLPAFEEGILRAVNECLDRDTAGAIAGAILGAKWGIQGIPHKWKTRVEKSQTIIRLAQELIQAAQG
jgi:ADP-ribosyl-[dinitrogen reductase] hydrolase